MLYTDKELDIEYAKKCGSIEITEISRDGLLETVEICVNSSGVDDKIFNEFIENKYIPVVETIRDIIMGMAPREVLTHKLSTMCNWEFTNKKSPFDDKYNGRKILIWDRRQNEDLDSPIMAMIPRGWKPLG